MFRANNFKQARRELMVIFFLPELQVHPECDLGPARAYTLRGKYRQFFLRVSADNTDELISANVVIQPDRTLDVVVEMVGLPEFYSWLSLLIAILL
jgi:hypothetical protein